MSQTIISIFTISQKNFQKLEKMIKVVLVSMQIILTLSHQLNQFQQDNGYFHTRS